MAKFFSKGSSLLAGAIGVAGTAILPLSALSQEIVPIVPSPPPLQVIQGKVTNIQGNRITVKTPDVKPVCPPNIPCLLIITVGPTFNVDLSTAVFQSASGSSVLTPPALIVGDSVVVAGRLGVSTPLLIPTPAPPPKLIVAEVVTKAAL